MASTATSHQERSDSERREPPSTSSSLQADENVSRPQAKARRRNRVIHSCLACRRRKMKCDRAEQCENCRTSGQQCIYVTSADTDGQLSQKLTQIKEAKDTIDNTLLGGVQDRPKRNSQRRKRSRTPIDSSSDDAHQSSAEDDDGYLEPTPLAVQDAAYANDADDQDHDHDIDSLGFKIGRMRLTERIGGLYRPWIADEILSSLQHSKKHIPPLASSPVVSASADKISQAEPPAFTPSVNIIFGLDSSYEPLAWCIPPRNITDKLLEHYWSAVHPIVRILHRPSFAQRYETFWELIENGHQVTPSLVAIVCSVLFSALSSMSEDQVLVTCHISKSELSTRLKIGTEAALSKANLLKSTKTETVQAFVAYLLTISIDEISRAHSVLTGMVIRLAECMGLHRDPTEYSFSPAECQTRRLIWYQICYLDIKTSDIQGPRQFIYRNGYTTQLPLDMTSSPSDLSVTSRPWNDMIFSMIRFECQEMQRECLTLRRQVDRKKLGLTKAISKIEAFRISMDAKYGPYLNTASPGPMQKMGSLVMKLFVNLLYLVLLHRYMNSVTYRIPDRLRQIVLTKGTEALEAAVKLDSSEDLRKWAWYSASYQQYHTAFLLLFEVFTFPLRREASRIWQCLDWVFADVLINIPPLESASTQPTLQEIVAHRDMKATYLLTTIAEGMRKYQRNKGMKSPKQFKDSMIVITPQKAGDNSDPKMPLNYAHEELEVALGSLNPHIISDTQIPCHTESEPKASQPATVPGEDSLGSVNRWPQALYNTSSYHTASSGAYSSQIQYASSGHDGVDVTKFQPYHPRFLGVTSTSNDSSVAAHSIGGESDELDPQMPEIDWDLWDTMFPPDINNGSLDITSDCLWSPLDALDS